VTQNRKILPKSFPNHQSTTEEALQCLSRKTTTTKHTWTDQRQIDKSKTSSKIIKAARIKRHITQRRRISWWLALIITAK
jgi:hypothetical protein